MKFKYYFSLIIIFYSCSLKPSTIHNGVINLKQKQEVFILNQSNKNDVVKELGETLLKEYPNEETWIYVETESKKNFFGKKNILKNDILVLDFNTKGILINKIFLDKKNMKNIKIDNDVTETLAISDSDTKKFLASMRKRFQSITNKKID